MIHAPHHAEGLVNPKVHEKRLLILDTPVQSIFFQNVILIHKMSKLAKIDRFSNFLWLFSRFSGRGTHPGHS
jgi:hypothetical protein